jgi:MFS family permease
MKNELFNFNRNEWLIVIVVALGYYFDAFDIILFSALRKPSLLELGVAESDVMNIGLTLLNWQLIGLVVGGLLFGVLADKFGRRNTLFFSILLYSLANLANAYVPSVEVYGWLRFLAGVGLAGELGVGIALITENIPREKRTYATTIVSMFGMLGAISGGVAALNFHWKTCYLIGFAAGMLLLFLRIGTKESVLFKEVSKQIGIKRGSLVQLFTTPRLLWTFLICTLAGGTLFTTVALFIQNTPEFGAAFGVTPAVTGAMAVVCYYCGAAPSEIFAGLFSKRWKSRKKPMYLFYAIQLFAIIFFCINLGTSPSLFYFKCWLLGFSLGYWTLLITTSAEQFGTNIRGTAATAIPNFARGWSIPFTLLFKAIKPEFGLISSGLIVGLSIVILAILSASQLKETFENDANFVEQ